MFDKLKLLLLKAAFDTVCKQRDELKDKLQAERMRCESLLKKNVELGECLRRSRAKSLRLKGMLNVHVGPIARINGGLYYDPTECAIMNDKQLTGSAFIREHLDGTRVRIDPRCVIINNSNQHEQD